MFRTIRKNFTHVRWVLVTYDSLIFLAVAFAVFHYLNGPETISLPMRIGNACILYGCTMLFRFLCSVYRQVWRYGGVQPYLRMIGADCLGCAAGYLITELIPGNNILFIRVLCISCMVLLASLIIRLIYLYSYRYGNHQSLLGKFGRLLLLVFSFGKTQPDSWEDDSRVKIAIVGAGRSGTELAESLTIAPRSSYRPVVFIDNDPKKIGRYIHDIPVESVRTVSEEFFKAKDIKTVVLTVSDITEDEKRHLYEFYIRMGVSVKVYDYPKLSAGEKKKALRDFDIEDLLFREPVKIQDAEATAYYRGKTVLITGGGGSIGSEICRQLAKMEPRRLIVLDIAENGAYDVQQDLRLAYGRDFSVSVEICSVCDERGLRRVFTEYRPEVVVMAAAHKHVPLMEKNCIEAVSNNIFGTLNTVKVSVEFGAERVIMVSTDKAVNPTNIMGATKRFCEKIVQSYSSLGGKTTFSSTRFGNVLGSAGSVIPLFRRQIQNGGPITVTDKRIIRYFMTIPEASQLVLESGAMAKNGDLFVLDMGNPVKIIDLAENMIRLSGLNPGVDIEIIETGLRPGEKLFEELLIQTENLTKTKNKLIFVEHDTPVSMNQLNEELDILRAAVETDSDKVVREALHRVVPTFRTPEEINKNV